MRRLNSFFRVFVIFVVIIFSVEYFFSYGFHKISWALLLENFISILPSIIVVFFVFYIREIKGK
jgi:hypothetical protein